MMRMWYVTAMSPMERRINGRSATTADGRDAYVGRILMSMDDMAYAESDILIFPDIKYVVTITGVQKTGSKLPLDVRKITDTVRIIY